MAEVAAVIGLVASVASLVDLSAKIVSRLRDFTAQTSDVPESFRSLADRLPLLSHTLQRIEARAQAGHVEDNIAKDLERLVNSISDQVKFLQQYLERTLPKDGVSQLERALKGLKSLAKENKVKQALQKIHQGIDVIVLHQATSHVDTGDRILRELSQLNLNNPSLQITFGLCLGRSPQIEPDAFIGRRAEMQQLHEWLSNEGKLKAQKVVSIVGMGGLGKTQLSLAYAREQGHRYSSVFWLNAKDEMSLRQSMEALGGVIFPGSADLAVTNADHENLQVVKVRRWLSESWNDQWLIIYDNYDDPDLPNTQSHTGFDLRSFFPTRVQGSILITTRSPKLTFSKRMMLTKLDDVDMGVAILSQRSGRDMTIDPDARGLAIRLDGLPLALAASGTYLAQTGVSCGEYLQAYESTWMDLHGPDSEKLLEYEDRTLSSTWTISLNQVTSQDPDAADLLKFLACLSHQDIWYELLQASADGAPPWVGRITNTKIRFDRAMARLRDYSLIESLPGLYRIHPCLHDWITEQFNTPPLSTSFLTALKCVERNIPDESNLGYWTTTRRLLQHLQRLQIENFRSMWKACALDVNVLDGNHAFGDLYCHWGRLNEAEQMYKRALEGKERVLGQEHASTLHTVNNLGILYRAQGKPKQAEQMYKRALEGKEKVLGREHPSTLNTVNSLGLLYADQGKLEAEQMYKRALVGCEKTLGGEHISTLHTINNLGILYADQGKLEQAEQMYRRALEGKESTLGREHASTLDTVNNLGILYRAQGKLEQAEQMYKRALEGQEKVLGQEHISTLNTVNNLGLLYADQGNLKQAEQMYKRALIGCEKALGEEHFSTLNTVNNLGLLYADQGKLEQAEQMCRRALEGKERALGREHASTLDTVHNLGLISTDQGKLEQAEQMYKRALEGKEKVLGREHASTLDTVNNLGNLSRIQCKLDVAEMMYQQALEGYEKALGREHMSTINAVNNLATLYAERGMSRQAEQMNSRAICSFQGFLREHSSPPQAVIRGYAAALYRSMRLATVDRLVAQSTTARLLELVRDRGKEDRVMFGWLGKAMVYIGDDKNAQVAFHYSIRHQSDEVADFGEMYCNGCIRCITVDLGLSVCRQCVEVDLCNDCMSKYATNSITLPTCANHDFFHPEVSTVSPYKATSTDGEFEIDTWINEVMNLYQV